MNHALTRGARPYSAVLKRCAILERSVHSSDFDCSRTGTLRSPSRFRRDALGAQVTREVFAPSMQCRLADIEARAHLAYRFHDNMHMWMWFIGM